MGQDSHELAALRAELRAVFREARPAHRPSLPYRLVVLAAGLVAALGVVSAFPHRLSVAEAPRTVGETYGAPIAGSALFDLLDAQQPTIAYTWPLVDAAALISLHTQTTVGTHWQTVATLDQVEQMLLVVADLPMPKLMTEVYRIDGKYDYARKAR